VPEDQRAPAAPAVSAEGAGIWSELAGLPVLEGERALEVLAEGRIEVAGRLPWSSNRTFLATCRRDEDVVPAVYKPGRGERPLWDFPGGLYHREVAAYELSRHLGWGFVPETVLRHDAPLGPGSLQRFVPADFSEHYFSLLEGGGHEQALQAICAFDVVANNADRKSGHCLLGHDGRIWGVDHGLCFHRQHKLRTVIWDWSGERIPRTLLADLERLAEELPPALAGLLDDAELEALERRVRALVDLGRFPAPDPRVRPYPWPLV
jgi:uncharacterized repeat protein (TIGR03843 family)